MNDPPNPYSPPREACNDETALGNAPRQNVLLEIVRAFTTIIGIFIGWIFVGAGSLNGTSVPILLGCLIIGVACMIGIGVRFDGESLRKRLG